MSTTSAGGKYAGSGLRFNSAEISGSKAFALKAATLIFMLFSILASFFILARVFGYSIHISKIRPFSLQGISYHCLLKKTSLTITSVSLRFHIPNPSAPYFGILVVEGYEYRDTNCHYSCGSVEVTLWFFPVLFRVSNEPWTYSKVEDFRLRVFQSAAEPWWIERLRNNVVSTFLNGETVRLHDFKTRIYFNTITGITSTKENSLTGELEKPGLHKGEEQDEARVRAQIEQWKIYNLQERMYTFGKLDVEVRRNWVEDRGSLVMVTEDCMWTKLPSFAQREGTYRKASWIWQTLIGICYMPSEIIAILCNPLAATDLHILRADITYEQFRFRDTEMMKQSVIKARRPYDEQRKAGNWNEIGLDTFVNTIIAVCFPTKEKGAMGEAVEVMEEIKGKGSEDTGWREVKNGVTDEKNLGSLN